MLVAAAAALSVAWAAFAAGRRAVVLGIGLAMSWGLAWIAVGRFQGELVNPTVAWAAVAASALALLAALVAATRRSRP
ncbi:Uncharacterised protein [Mycobacteroides abscessus]|nr:Uncharacterised protein [Mycobacteroides abscessus]